MFLVGVFWVVVVFFGFSLFFFYISHQRSALSTKQTEAPRRRQRRYGISSQRDSSVARVAVVTCPGCEWFVVLI